MYCTYVNATHTHSTHVLRVTIEKMEAALKDADSERVDLTNQIQDLKEEMMSLSLANEEARKMQTVALEERSKVSGAINCT